MTDTQSDSDCMVQCTPQGARDRDCDCKPPGRTRNVKFAKYGAGFLGLCAICCAVPPVLIGFGIIGVATGAYLAAGAKVALTILAVVGLIYLVSQYVKPKRQRVD